MSRGTIGLLSPLVGMKAAGDAMYQVSPGMLWTSLLLVHAMAWAFVSWATVYLRKSLQSDGEVIVHSRKVSRCRRARFTGVTTPIAWLVSRQRGVRTMIWSAVAVGFLLFGMRYITPFLYASRMTTLVYATMWPLSLAQSVVVGSLFAWAASRFFFEARRTGELELLVTTPVGAKTIVSAQWNALWRMVRWPLVAMILPFCFQVLTMGMHLASSWHIVYMFSTLLGLINTVLGVLVLFWLGMWFGLKSPTQTIAIVRAVAWGKGVPICLSLASLLIINLAGSILGFGSLRNLIIPLLPQVVVIAYYLWLLKRMKEHLQGELRDVDPVWGGAATEASALWKRGMGMLRDARHWTPMNSK